MARARTMAKLVATNIDHDGVRYAPGSVLSVEAESAARLLKAGAARAVLASERGLGVPVAGGADSSAESAPVGAEVPS